MPSLQEKEAAPNIPAPLKHSQSPSPLKISFRHKDTQHLPRTFFLFLFPTSATSLVPEAVAATTQTCQARPNTYPDNAVLPLKVSVCGPQQPAQSNLTRCSSSLSLYGNHRGWHVCRTHHGSTAIVLDVTSLASTWWLSSLGRPSPVTPQTKHSSCLRAKCSQLGSLVLLLWALAALPCQTSHPSLAGAFPNRKSTSDMSNTSIKRRIRPTEEKTLPQVTAPWGWAALSSGSKRQASELSDFLLI